MLQVLQPIKTILRRLIGKSAFLCDDCRYNWRDACRRPGRPNVRRCPDHYSR